MKLREILKKKDSELYARLEAIHDYFEKSFGDFLGVTYISTEEKTVYTGHGIGHSKVIEKRLNKLIPVKIKEQFKASEIFILLCGVLLHDIGMKYEYHENEDIESIRRTHNYRSQKFIKENYQEIGLTKEERIPIGFLAYAHRGDGTIDELEYEFPCCGENIRLKFLACLLRLGDELDISRDRAPTIMRELIKFTGASEEHWDLLKKLDEPVIDTDKWTITIKAEIDNPLEEHQILILRYKIQKELDKIKEVLRTGDLHYDKINYYLDKEYGGKPELSGEEIKKRISIPFPLLNSYGYNEWSHLFFGREDEINDLAGLVLSNRVTFLTGESAVGKTSLLQAGLMPKLIANPKNPEKIVIYVRCGKDPIKSVRDQIMNDFPEYEKLADLVFQDFVKEIGKGKEKVIIIDQFEEIFTIVPVETKDVFLDALRTLLNDNTFRIRLVLSFRREFEGLLAEELPSLWKNRYKIERLTLRKTKEVITETCRYWGIEFEKGLVDEIIDDIGEHGTCFPPDIQIVCYSLLDALDKGEYKDELLITEKLYKKLGGAGNIIENYFEKLLDEFQPDEKDTVMEILKKMITGSNTKNMLTLNEIASNVGHEIDVEKTIKKLVEKTIVRYLPEDNKYELIHDVLVKKIEEMLTEEEKEMKIAKYSLDFAMSSRKRDKSSLISVDSLNAIYKFLDRMNLTEEEVDLTLKSSLEHISDPHWDVRKNVVDAFGIMKDKRCVEPLIKRLNKEEIPEVKQAIVIALGEIGIGRAVDTLINRLNDEYMYVKADAVKALGKIGDKRAVKPLMKKLSAFEYWNVKKAAAIALGKIGDKSAIRALKERLEDVEVDKDVKKAVISALNMLGESVSSVKDSKGTQIPEPKRIEQITLRLPVIPEISYTCYYVTEDKGYYNEIGLDVDISYGEKGAMDPVEKLAEEKAQFGLSTGDTVILARSRNLPVVSVYQIAQNNSFCIISKRERAISRLEDFMGKKIAIAGFDSPAYIGCRVILYEAGVDHRNVEFIESGKNYLNNLLDDKVAAGSYHLAQKVLLERKGVKINVNSVSNYVNLVPECTVVNEKMIKENPELIKKFISATDKGLRYAVEHPNEAVDSFIRFNPEKSKERDFYLDSWKEYVCSVVLNNVVKKHGLGWSSEKQWVESQNVLSEMGIINTKTDVSKMFTNQFIELD